MLVFIYMICVFLFMVDKSYLVLRTDGKNNFAVFKDNTQISGTTGKQYPIEIDSQKVDLDLENAGAVTTAVNNWIALHTVCS